MVYSDVECQSTGRSPFMPPVLNAARQWHLLIMTWQMVALPWLIYSFLWSKEKLYPNLKKINGDILPHDL